MSNPQLTKDQFVDFVRNARLAVVATVSEANYQGSASGRPGSWT